VKIDPHARIEWQKAYGRSDRTDRAWDIRETNFGDVVTGDSYWLPADYDLSLMTLDPDGDIESDACGVVTAMDTILLRTRAEPRAAGVLGWDPAPKAVAPWVTATRQDWPIEACVP
jgi:hypothetical protein